MKKRIILLIISALLLVLPACGEKEDDNNTNSTTTQATTAVITEDRSAKDDLGTYDFKEYVFHMFTRKQDFFHSELDFAEITGDLLNDEIYNRNRKIEARFNMTFKETTYTDQNQPLAMLRAGDLAYDIMSLRCVGAFNAAQEGLIYSIGELEQINTDKVYWNERLTNDLAVANKKYFAVGTFNLTSYDFTHILVFNKKLVKDLGLKDPYALVTDGKWTWEEMSAMMKENIKDLDADGKYTDKDSYGILSSAKQIPPCMWIAANQMSVKKDKEDIPYLAMKEQSFIDVFDKIYSMFQDSNAWYKTSVGDTTTNAQFITMYEADRALFLDSTFYNVNALRGTLTDFGILPYPKLDEKQTEYYSRIEGCELFMVSKAHTAESAERASVILEAMACESYATVLPVYYDLALKSKTTRDAQSADMIDVIFKNRVFDYGDTIWCPEIRDGFIGPMFIANDKNLASRVESVENTIKNLVDKTVTAFEKLK